MSKQLKVLVLVGPPGAGKTTWAKEFISKNEGWVRINRDDYRSMLKNQPICEHKIENLINKLVDDAINTSLNNNLNVIVDNTNLQARYINNILKLVQYKASVDYRVFDIPLKTAIERNEKREKKVDEKIIRKMYADFQHLFSIFNFAPVYKKKKIDKEYIKDENKKNVILCDLDGTLSLLNGRNPFDATDCEYDIPNIAVITTVDLYYKSGYNIIFVSGREDKFRDPTEKFIAMYLPNIKYELFMRKTADNRKDSIVKKEIYDYYIKDKYNILLILDDRNQVVNMWRQNGLTCFQVAEGDF